MTIRTQLDEEFTVFVKEIEPRLSYALAAAYVSVDGEEWHAMDPQPLPRNGGFIHSWGNRLLVFGEDSNMVGTVEIRGG